MHAGHLLEATDCAIESYNASNTKIDSPVAQAFTLKGLYLAHIGFPGRAINLLRQSLWLRPDDRYTAEGMALALEDKYAPLPKRVEPGRIIIGLGSGRSGSSSITNLLNSQKDSHIAHEAPPRMGWSQDHNRLAVHMRRFNILRQYHGFVGDVSHWWLPYAEQMLEQDVNICFVAMQRNKEATVNSYLKIKGYQGNNKSGAINHWIEHDGTFFEKNIWDEAYPKFDVDNLPDALSMYWDTYYEECTDLQQRYPDRFRIFETERLEDSSYQLDILKFCGFENPVLEKEVRLNAAGSVEDGAKLV